ncbi:MAG: rRNA adenine N-6-methyltransferase family protein, partial [Verrucomicrobiota bacterium]
MDFQPRKNLGQNFLIDRNILEIILSFAEPERDDRILEVGPGLGVITEHLANRTAQVTAIEKDPKLFVHLSERFKNTENIRLMEGDAL